VTPTVELAVLDSALANRHTVEGELGRGGVEVGRGVTSPYEEHSSWLSYLNVEFRLDRLWSDPRFAGLVRWVGLPRPAEAP
jgi:hypothetical protein